MKKTYPYIVVILAILLTGCSASLPATQSQPNTSTVSVTEVTEVSIETSTMSPPTPTESVEQCFGMHAEFSANVAGRFVLSGDYDMTPDPSGIERHRAPSYISVPLTQTKLELPRKSDEVLWYFSVSPDKKSLAYYAENQHGFGRVVIAGNDGALRKEYSDREWYSVLGWIDNNHVLASEFGGELPPYSTIILDPFNKDERKLVPDFPDIYAGYPWMWSWKEFASVETVYSPDLSMVVYLKRPSQTILWDIKRQKVITELDDPSASSSPPLWLGDGKHFIVDNTISSNESHLYREELMSVSINGEIQRLTHLVDLYKDVDIRRFSESSNGRYIAFWFSHSSPDSVPVFQLAIYDTINATTKIICVDTVEEIYTPVWSPSGNQLLVAGYLDIPENYGTILVDVESGYLSQVEKSMIPVGWMVDK